MAVTSILTKNESQMVKRFTESVPISKQPSSNTRKTMNNDQKNSLESKR